jgi:hypothetical protein
MMTPISTEGIWTPENNEIMKPVINVKTNEKKKSQGKDSRHSQLP